MARLGVSYQDIADAANFLLAQGKAPTIELNNLRGQVSRQDRLIKFNISSAILSSDNGCYRSFKAGAASH